MQTLEQFISGAGRPRSRIEFSDAEGQVAACHWWHNAGRFAVRSADALRVNLNLGCSFNGVHAGGGEKVGIASTVGGIRMFAPGTSCETTGEGTIHAFEVVIEARGFGLPTRDLADLPPLSCADEDVRAAMVATFVASRFESMPRYRQASDALRRAAARFLLIQLERRSRPQTGGLRPTTRHAVERLIQEQLVTSEDWQSVEDFAARARLSVNHFIRAFRQVTGESPYQHVLARRRQRALTLLRDPDLSVGDIADLLAFRHRHISCRRFGRNSVSLLATTGMLSLASALRSRSSHSRRTDPGSPSAEAHVTRRERGTSLALVTADKPPRSDRSARPGHSQYHPAAVGIGARHRVAAGAVVAAIRRVSSMRGRRRPGQDRELRGHRLAERVQAIGESADQGLLVRAL